MPLRYSRLIAVFRLAKFVTRQDFPRRPRLRRGTLFYNWRKKYAGLMPSEMKRLKQLEEENGKLKRLVADLSLDKVMLQDVIKRKL